MKRIVGFDEEMMREVLSLAEEGRGCVYPNPLVGCILVKNGSVIACSYHERFGGEHAEARAIAQAGAEARDSVLYVNLEPCCHYGKTPPCTQRIITAGIQHVVVAMIDPNPLVNGKGKRTLEHAGISVQTGVLQEEARRLNRAYLEFIEKNKSFHAKERML